MLKLLNSISQSIFYCNGSLRSGDTDSPSHVLPHNDTRLLLEQSERSAHQQQTASSIPRIATTHKLFRAPVNIVRSKGGLRKYEQVTLMYGKANFNYLTLANQLLLACVMFANVDSACASTDSSHTQHVSSPANVRRQINYISRRQLIGQLVVACSPVAKNTPSALSVHTSCGPARTALEHRSSYSTQACPPLAPNRPIATDLTTYTVSGLFECQIKLVLFVFEHVSIHYFVRGHHKNQ